MYIRYVVNQFPKVSETFIIRQVTDSIDRGNKVDIFARFDPKQELTHPVIDEYNLYEKTIFSQMPGTAAQRIVKLPNKIGSLKLNELESSTEGFRILKYGRDAVSLQLFYSLLSYPDNDADIVHAHFGSNGILGAAVKYHGRVNNLVVTFHGTDIEQPYLIKNRYGPVFNLADLLIVKSSHNRNKLVNLGAPPSKIEVLPVGVDLNRFEYRWEDTDVHNVNNIVILSIGRLSPEKGHIHAIEAIKRLLPKINNKINIEYRIIGDGERKQHLQQKVIEFGLNDTVKFLGPQFSKEVSNHIGKAHIFLHPSIREGFGKVLLEAQAGALPIVTTNVGGIPEAVDGGRSALLVSGGDPDELVEQLDHLLHNRNLWEQMGKCGREYVQKNFDSEEIYNRLHRLYLEILND